MVDADRQRTDGRRLDGYTISSSCEAYGSGELIMRRMKRRPIHIAQKYSPDVDLERFMQDLIKRR